VRKQRRRAKPLIDFDGPLRRKFPLSQPSILKRLELYNKTRSYDFRFKPFGFIESATPATEIGKNDPLPIPLESCLAKAKCLPWIDFNTGKPLRLDWHGSHMDENALGDSVERVRRALPSPSRSQSYRSDGNALVPDAMLLGRLMVRSEKLVRIGKKADRLDQDEGASLEPEQAIEYERDDLAEAIAYLAKFPQAVIAGEIGMSERRWRDIANANAKPREATARRIARTAQERC
jgi:hypothetical protein